MTSASSRNGPAPSDSRPGRCRSGSRSELIGVDALALWLGVEVAFVRRLVAERRIPFLKIGKYVRFDSDEVALWIDDQRVAMSRPRQRPSRY